MGVCAFAFDLGKAETSAGFVMDPTTIPLSSDKGKARRGMKEGEKKFQEDPACRLAFLSMTAAGQGITCVFVFRLYVCVCAHLRVCPSHPPFLDIAS